MGSARDPRLAHGLLWLGCVLAENATIQHFCGRSACDGERRARIDILRPGVLPSEKRPAMARRLHGALPMTESPRFLPANLPDFAKRLNRRIFCHRQFCEKGVNDGNVVSRRVHLMAEWRINGRASKVARGDGGSWPAFSLCSPSSRTWLAPNCPRTADSRHAASRVVCDSLVFAAGRSTA